METEPLKMGDRIATETGRRVTIKTQQGLDHATQRGWKKVQVEQRSAASSQSFALPLMTGEKARAHWGAVVDKGQQV
ncbi:hypothetical protein [Pseudomonas sp. PLMAX]|uniref:hypothetical protein n=1 Tax=Pseudomonas sp. PLMAX TaxID=2201998 RepID=UPI0038B9FD3A